MDIIEIIEAAAFVTGIIYIVLEILQKNSMWILGILTGIACAYSFGVQGLYASMGLNVYYVFVSVWGLVQWRKDSGASEGAIHLNRLTPGAAAASAAMFAAGTLVLGFLLQALGGSETWLDAGVTMLSAIGTFWLARSYPQQWLVWIVADALYTVLCAVQGMPWMTVLYVAYTAAAAYGYFHWTRSGKYLE